MEVDESGIVARQKAIQSELNNPKVKEFGGRVFYNNRQWRARLPQSQHNCLVQNREYP